MISDFRLTFRHLLKSRGFALVAILTLGVGICSVTTIYSVLRALVLEPFEYPESQELAQVWSGDYWPLSPADYLSLKEENQSFESLGVYQPSSFNVGEENAIAVDGVQATADVLVAFGVNPQRGRLLKEEDELEGAEPVAVISHGLWQTYFGAREDIVGSTVRLSGENRTVVGVMPAGFEFSGPWIRTQDCKVWLPFRMSEKNRSERGSHWLCGIGRLKDGVTVEMADQDIKAIGKRLSELYPNTNFSKKFLVRSLNFEMTRDLSKQVWLLFAAVGLVLLVACSNVASMQLSRGAKRQGEFAVRLALGATRRDLVRLAFAESLVLALGGALLGLAMAFGGLEVLKAISPASAARKAAMTIDGSIMLFVVIATLLTALLAGLPPVYATLRSSLATVIRNDGRGAVGSVSRNRMLRALVIGQVAVAFILANGAVLFSAGYFRLLDENKLLSTESVLVAQVTLQGERYRENEDRVKFWDLLEERLSGLPGVREAAISSKLPLNGGSNTNGLVNDEVYDPSQQRISIERSSVTEGYFEAMGLQLQQGRGLRPEDDMAEDGQLGVVVNRAMVEKAWPDENPLGQVIRANMPSDPWYTATVVGVVEDVKQWSASAEVQPEMYTTPPGHWGSRIYLVLRASKGAQVQAENLRATVAGLDSELALERIRTMRQVVDDSTQGERALAGLVNAFMGIALGLVAVGLYGTLSYNTLQRTREIGVRRALGALERDIGILVFRQGTIWVSIGLVIGVGGIYSLTTVLNSMVHGMEGLSGGVLALSGGVVLAAALSSCWLPARRASKLDPLEALRR
ncbi:ABC transporter permease [Pelagicoccus sp. SDUM812002]|uniref:ABC transporter permease n=1 Tax=Pelagicoccus sp. SDUM812002 TaxID=3041266 RepID=UPI00280E7674|nr:ABC transporter permease [Pelagicoccus sp. SDUM812002]MDQ8188120.1 ABC transporter permease [Pelagicoccus sp. SDUM812002]